MNQTLFEPRFTHLNVLLLINILVFASYILLQSSILGYDSEYVEIFGALSGRYIDGGYFWLLITSAFLHLSPIHFIFNILALFQIGKIVEVFYSGRELFTTFIIGAFAANFLTIIAFSIELLPHSISVGASGGIFALLGLLIGGILKKNRCGVGIPIEIKVFMPTLVLSVLISFMPNVNFYAHLGGFIIGILFGFVFENKLNQNQRANSKFVVTSLYVVSTVGLVLSYAALFFNLLLG